MARCCCLSNSVHTWRHLIQIIELSTDIEALYDTEALYNTKAVPVYDVDQNYAQTIIIMNFTTLDRFKNLYEHIVKVMFNLSYF